MSEETYRQPVEPTHMTPPYEYREEYSLTGSGIPPPPPQWPSTQKAPHSSMYGHDPYTPLPPKKSPKRRIILPALTVVLALLLIAGGIAGNSLLQKDEERSAHTTATAEAKVNATAQALSLTNTAEVQQTSLTTTQIAVHATATQVEVNATTTQQEIDATVTASIPTPVPIPTQAPLSTAQDLYTDFTNAGIGMANEGTIQNSEWTCCTYHPGKGSVQFTDVSSGGNIIAALFNTTSGAQTDQQQAHDAWGWGTYLVGTCLLLYQSSYTNLTPYEQVMNQYCT